MKVLVDGIPGEQIQVVDALRAVVVFRDGHIDTVERVRIRPMTAVKNNRNRSNKQLHVRNIHA